VTISKGEGRGLQGEGASGTAHAGRRQVLVIDDEPALAAMIGRMIEDDFDVEIISDSRPAMASITTLGRKHDVILCDLMMPYVSGAELFRDASLAVPGIERRFVFMTGGVFTPWVAEFLAGCARPCLEKPFAYAALRAILAAA
jgi:two-component system cell cycle sensor histidine kinase/response regulator CckA